MNIHYKALSFAASLLLISTAVAQTKDKLVASSTAQSRIVTQQVGGKAHDDTFVIGADDVLAINVWKEPDLSRSIPVRSDGKISLPLVGELQASGQTPSQLEKEIAGKLKSYVSEPE